MQPYFLPYIGYFQLINSVKKFVILDDVNFINRGWINRNNILVNKEPNLFTIPLKAASQNKFINEISIDYSQNWQNKLMKSLQTSYRKSKCFNNVYDIFQQIIESKFDSISELNTFSIKKIIEYLNINTEVIESSSHYENKNLTSQNRIIDICHKEDASVYINPIGGSNLYDKQLFIKHNLELYFIKTKSSKYAQFNHEFHPGLSIIDVLMFNEKEQINLMLEEYELL